MTNDEAKNCSRGQRLRYRYRGSRSSDWEVEFRKMSPTGKRALVLYLSGPWSRSYAFVDPKNLRLP